MRIEGNCPLCGKKIDLNPFESGLDITCNCGNTAKVEYEYSDLAEDEVPQMIWEKYE